MQPLSFWLETITVYELLSLNFQTWFIAVSDFCQYISNFWTIKVFYSLPVAVTWLKFCRYHVKLYPINQSTTPCHQNFSLAIILTYNHNNLWYVTTWVFHHSYYRYSNIWLNATTIPDMLPWLYFLTNYQLLSENHYHTSFE